VPDGKITSFHMAVKQEPGEAVMFSWTAMARPCDLRSRLAGDDGRCVDDGMEMPFDGMRMMWGGFEELFHARA
jgi:uncharacterized protein YbaA (DUF1428 family)